MVWLCVTFKFVCFDGTEGKKLADEVVREKGERKKEKGRKRALKNVLEFKGSVRKKEERRKKKEKKIVRVHV